MVKTDFPEISLVVFVSQEKKNLNPLGEEKPAALFLVAGKKIVEWAYTTGKQFGIERIVLLANNDDKRLLYEHLKDYMETSAPVNEIGPFTIVDFDSKKGITEEVKQSLDGRLAKHTIWADGNVVFSKEFLQIFIEQGLASGKTALYDKKNCMGIGFFDKKFLASSTSKAQNVEDIYSKIKAEVRSATKEMEFKKDMEFWQINYLWNLLDANEYLIKSIEAKNEGKIEDGVTIIGDVIIGYGSRIRAGSYLEGPLVIGKNCDIGPNCYLRKGVSLGNEVRIGNACELKNTIVFNGTHIAHLSYVGDSIVGENCNFGAGTITGNLRLDGLTIKSQINNKVLSTYRRKVGVIMGDNVKTAINTYFMPGVVVGNNSAIGTGVIVSRNVESNVFLYIEQKQQSREWKIKPKKKK
jgi:NDP-sugar pyrophosphorylase family protein